VGLSGRRQNADIADTLHLRDVASRGVFLGSSYRMNTADFEVVRDVAMATILAFYTCGAHWRRLKNTTEPSMCDGDAALCQITLTTCLCYLNN